MTNGARGKLIEDRAREIFSRENRDPTCTWDAKFFEPGKRGDSAAVGEGLREEVRRRAAAELISEGKIMQ